MREIVGRQWRAFAAGVGGWEECRRDGRGGRSKGREGGRESVRSLLSLLEVKIAKTREYF